MRGPELSGKRAFAAFSVAAIRRFFGDHCFQIAAGLTFTTLLSLVPLLAVVLSIASTFSIFDHWVEVLQNFMFRNFLPDAGRKLIRAQLTEFSEKATQLTAFGVAFLGVTSFSLMLSIDETFNRLFRVTRRRGALKRAALYIGGILVVPFLIGASVSVTSWLVAQSAGWFGQPRWVSIGVLRTVPYVFTCVAFTLVYRLLPNRPVRWRHALAGGLIAALAFEVAKHGFGFYIRFFPTYTLVYGAFAIIPIFLLWIYMSWVVALAGATITAVLPGYDERDSEPPGAPDSGKIALHIQGEHASMSAAASAYPSIDRRDRLIVALDVPTVAEAKALVESLGDSVRFYKVGLELFTSGQYFELIEWLAKREKKIFADLKLYDIPETVRRAVANLKGRGVTFLTVHGHRSVMEAAVSAQSGIQILAVTVLTSFDKSDLAEMGAAGEVGDLVLSRARGALESGCSGVISSGHEAPQIKAAFGARLLVVTPGIRPAENKPSDDQKRTVDVAQAFANGADYIVVGRPIRQAAEPRVAAEAIQATIAGRFAA